MCSTCHFNSVVFGAVTSCLKNQSMYKYTNKQIRPLLGCKIVGVGVRVWWKNYCWTMLFVIKWTVKGISRGWAGLLYMQLLKQNFEVWPWGPQVLPLSPQRLPPRVLTGLKTSWLENHQFGYCKFPHVRARGHGFQAWTWTLSVCHCLIAPSWITAAARGAWRASRTKPTTPSSK